ncbi:ABC transporter permease [Prescottella equi]|uniref:ABC transporter permease n=1 Tax=Rhodococcus hoagii TaxID=43767 RepID=A0A9Q2YWN0_RHOHA|nr:ABC transporter permease [Prescottella equi]MBM4480305.1 ABC transporter permease [Prescottella equi]MBM4488397.1 ABC transporter permease [Prescottella equi]MBM4495494.1 ABC transporter permease [Prescottella equi]MBM4499577.1 ABC transporter permease [Prescottella equi]MBM4503563.1 ABC transporter permease [Prescottella equi]
MSVTNHERLADNRFAAGTFAPNPQPAPPARMLASQTKLELTLLLRNGEQLLITMLIPITLLIGLTLLPIGDFGTDRVDTIVPAVMMVAIMSTAFTGQAIAVGFDRRYGALKRLGATPLPKWGIIAGKSAAVVIVVAMQTLILGAIGFALGWRPSVLGLALGAVVIALGTVTFACMGLLLGGSLRAEIVLALANILWFAMAGIGSVIFADQINDGVRIAAQIVPSGALAQALEDATSGTVNFACVAILAAWAAVTGFVATRTFKFV